MLHKRLDLGTAANVVDEDGEIRKLDAGRECFDLLTRRGRGIEYSGPELKVFVLSLELGFGPLKLFGIPAMQDDIEAVHCKLVCDSRTDALTSSCYQRPGSIAMEVALYG